LRLARVLAYREQYDEALKLLAVPNPGQFAERFSEGKGDIQAALGHVEEARAAYLAAMVADGSELLDRNFLQMKLNDLPWCRTGAVSCGTPTKRKPRGSDDARGRERGRGRVTERHSFSFRVSSSCSPPRLPACTAAPKKDTTTGAAREAGRVQADARRA
jgi:hypothetical protein